MPKRLKKIFFMVFLVFMTTTTFCTQTKWLLKKEVFRIPFEYGHSVFMINDDIMISDGEEQKFFIYSGDKVIKTINFRIGEGPGDYKSLSSAFTSADNILIWDSMQFRLNKYDAQFNYVSSEKINEIGQYGRILAKQNGNLYYLSEQYVKDPKGVRVIQHLGCIEADRKSHKIYEHDSGVMHLNFKDINLDRPILISAFANNSIIFASADKYQLYKIDLNDSTLTKKMIVNVEKEPKKWDEKITNLYWTFTKKAPNCPEIIYPKNIPPLFGIKSDGHDFAVITNDSITEGLSQIDIYSDETYRGSIKIPLLYYQHNVLPYPYGYNESVFLSKKSIIAMFYNESNDTFDVVKWKIVY